MKKTGIAVIAIGAVVVLGGGGYAIGAITNSTEPATNAAPAAPPQATPEVTHDATPEPSATPATPDEQFTAMLDNRIDTRDYPDDLLHMIGQEVCALIEDTGNDHPFRQTENSERIEYGAFIETWAAAVSTDGYCDQP